MKSIVSQIVSELRRREVPQVVLGYAIAAWLILQVAALTFPPLGLPESGVRYLIILSIAGFPAALTLAWMVDFKSQGMIFDLPLWRGGNYVERDITRADKRLAALFSVSVLVASLGLAVILMQKMPTPSSESPDKSISETVPENSIAVLAFENFGVEDESAYIGAGLAEEILNFLADIRELNVAARTSSFRFQNEKVDIREVAELLSVKYVLEGSVRISDERMRITVNLVDGIAGYRAWSSTYDRDFKDIFAVQQEIATAVVNELQIALSIASKNHLNNTLPDNLDAYVFYLQGQDRLRSSKDADVLLTARSLFEEALKIDSNYARAYGGLCEIGLRLYEISNSIQDFTDAEFACEKAQSLDKDISSEVHLALGRLYRFRGSYDKAIEKLELVISKAPGLPDGYIEMGETLLAKGEIAESKDMLLRAVDIKRNYWKAHEALGNFYYMTEQYQKSSQAYAVVTRLAPDLASGFASLGTALWMQGNILSAIDAYSASLELKPTRQAFTNLGHAYFYNGNFELSVEMQMKALNFAPEDHRIWGRLGESYRFIAGKEGDEQHAYLQAASYAQNNLEVNPEDWYLRAMLGIYNVHLGKQNEGMKLINEALKSSNNHPEVLYFKALALVDMGKQVQAIELLKEALTQEPSFRQFILMDPDLQQLSELPAFKQLIYSSLVAN